MKNFNIQKRTVFLVVLVFLTVIAFAQKTDMKNIKVSYEQLPLQPLDLSVKTYNSELSMNVTLENTDLNKLSNQYLKLQGYNKVETQEDVLIKANFGEFQINKELITKDVFNVNEGKNVTGYYYEITCEYPVRFSLIDNDGNTIFEQIIQHDEKLMNDDFEKWTYSIAELDTKFNAEKEELFTDIKNKCDKKALLAIKNILANNFSYLPVTKKIKIASGKGKKMDYSDLESAIALMEKAFEMISSESATADVNIELNKAISIWEEVFKESSNDKKARINEVITTMLYYNIGISYWWMSDFAKAREYTDNALKYNLTCSKPSSSNEKLINEAIEDMSDHEKRLKVHGKL
ncbi:MAG: hypothetical protein KOO66_12160 [Bacteroidales bacterium]|nr:hypothetical protein [Bacteroidales bacterium]